MNTILTNIKNIWYSKGFKYKTEYVDLPGGGRESINWADNS